MQNIHMIHHSALISVIHIHSKHLNAWLSTGADPACRTDRLPKFENSKMVWNYRELITCRLCTELMLGQVTTK